MNLRIGTAGVRNSNIFDQLLATLDDVPQNLWDAYAAAHERDTVAGVKGGGVFVETEYLRSIAFAGTLGPKPENAAAYIRGYIDEVNLDRMTAEVRPTLRRI